MKVALGVDCTRWTVWFTFACQTCGHDLVSADIGNLFHPTHDGTGAMFKGKPIDCPFVGKTFKRPVQLFDLEETGRQ